MPPQIRRGPGCAGLTVGPAAQDVTARPLA
jgi:hypothetical protein